MSETYTYKYPRPMVTVDLVVFGLGDGGLRSLFIRRRKEPFAGQWAIPGGYLEMDEEFEAGARRELKEETGLADLVVVEEIGTFGAVARDPRGRTISIAHAGIVRHLLPEVAGGDDASEAVWLDSLTAEHLAFDHVQILARGREWLRSGLAQGRFWFDLLPDPFAKSAVQALLRFQSSRRASAARWIASQLQSGKIERAPGKSERFRVITVRNRPG